jgi:hypothetical protein
MILKKPTLESILNDFQTRKGLYFLGAGASAGLAPFGHDFMSGPGLDFIRNVTAFAAAIPEQPKLNQKIIAATERSLKLLRYQLRRPEIIDLQLEILQRLPEGFARMLMQHQLAEALHARRPCDNYAVFEEFRPSLLLNYNHDGLAAERCGNRHRVIEMHGSIHPGLGSPGVAELIQVLRDIAIRLDDDGILLCVPESHADVSLVRRLQTMMRYSPEFVALIGYSFARNGSGHDDHVTLDYFQRSFRGFQGPVYVLDPAPEYICDMLAETLKSPNVVGVKVYWNILAHVFLQEIRCPGHRPSLDYRSQQLLDAVGDRRAFPLDAE